MRAPQTACLPMKPSRTARLPLAIFVLAISLGTWRLSGQGPESYAVVTFAGVADDPGSADGTGAAARFQDPNAITVDSAGFVYVADTPNHTIRKITPAGVVTTFAGAAGSFGSDDGTGTAARFNEPRGLTIDSAGNLYVGDTGNQTIRKITPGGVVTTLAGLAGETGSTDATGSAARFFNPHGVAVDSLGNVYVTDQTNHTIRRVTAAGVVTTLAGTAAQEGSTDATGAAARFSYPRSLAVDGAGIVYVADSNNHTIRKITPAGVVTTLAGLAGNDGFADGTGNAARFNEPNGITATSGGTLFVADTYNFSVRKVTPAGVVTTIAGQVGTHGTADGTGQAAHFGELKGVAVGADLIVYVADTDNHTVRKGTPPVVNTPPSITTQPTSQIIPFGTSVLLSVAATGTAPVTYQWYEGASPNTVSPIDGATASTYMTPALTISTAYWVRVTNVAGAADSNTATITVSPEGPDVIANGSFSAGMANWAVFEEPDMVSSVIDGVLHFHKANPPITASRQAVVFQQTGQAIASGQAVLAEFDLGNTDVVRKRISVLIIDSNFSDITVCTFWLPPNAPLQTYRMRTHATQAWTNASIYFYAASVGTGDYQLDNVELHTDAAGSDSQTACIDPTTPLPTGGADGPNLIANGDFGSGQLPPWGLFGDINSQITNGVFEFVRPGTPGVPAGVILQNTGAAMTVNQILTTSLQLGNSSAVRKRVTILVHEGDFSDLAACTFWLPPGQTLSTYVVRSFTTRAWVNATVSVYAGNVSAQPWIQLDNVTLQRTPAAVIQGTECIEPESVSPAVAGPLAAGASPVSVRDSASNPDRSGMAEPIGVPLWRSADSIDLTDVAAARLRFLSRIKLLASPGLVQASEDGVTWITVAIVRPSSEWEEQEVELDSLAGRRVYLRFVTAFGSGR